NPEFVSWSKVPKGTTVTLRMDDTTRLERKLVRIDADKVVVETTAFVKLDGKELQGKPKEEEVPKTAPQFGAVQSGAFGKVQPWMLGQGKAPAGVELGEEAMKVGGTEIKTRWVRQGDPKSVEVKMWVSEDVPGLFVRMD